MMTAIPLMLLLTWFFHLEAILQFKIIMGMEIVRIAMGTSRMLIAIVMVMGIAKEVIIVVSEVEAVAKGEAGQEGLEIGEEVEVTSTTITIIAGMVVNATFVVNKDIKKGIAGKRERRKELAITVASQGI